MEEEKDNEKNALLEKDHVEDESISSTSDNIDDDESNDTCDDDDDENDNNDESIPVPKRPSRVPFLTRKREAIRTLLDFDPNATEEKSAASSIADDFGYIASNSDPDITRAIRHHQTINMMKASLIKNSQHQSSNLGYSIVALRSTIPDAGRGIFIDGTARAGSIVGLKNSYFSQQLLPRHSLTRMIISTSHCDMMAFLLIQDVRHMQF